ncbi:FMN reductase [Lactococcus hircilactis]|uniref:FMN reductase n=1 Tax=Lactococcus hircilactis TaxID=1494462 RepID=A0A7X2CZT2_9LACT|nr:NADPH-dependent FMN reductase [Lactococcus hircilactis]MQW38483.1 FMN reductase [Lactococcus hircilactis]
MNYLILNGTIVGNKTRNLLEIYQNNIKEKLSETDSISFIDLKDKKMVFSDGRNWQDYSGDTLSVLTEVMNADVIVFGIPTFQASFPAPLKNIFDLLPEAAFLNKTIGFIVTAGSQKHYLVMENQLKPILTFMKANIMHHYVFAYDFDFKGSELESDDIEMRLESYAKETIEAATSYDYFLKQQEEQYDF